MKRQYEIGEIVESKLSKDWLMVVGLEDEKLICRTKNFEIISMNEFEVRKIRR